VRGVELLQRMAQTAEHAQRQRIDKTKKANGKALHEPDAAMRDLFGELTMCWTEAFGTIPGASQVTGGPFVRFTKSLLNGYAAAIPDRTEAVSPGICARLRLSPSRH